MIEQHVNQGKVSYLDPFGMCPQFILCNRREYCVFKVSLFLSTMCCYCLTKL